jgi:hypothetical protein
MAKDPAQRYQTPQAVADVLAPWTQTPIPPPPDEEMPQFSLAAMGSSGTEASLAGRTVPGGEPSPPPRKTWQVPATPAPAPASPAPAPAPVARAPVSPAPAAPPVSPTRPGPSIPTSPAPAAVPARAAAAPAPQARPASPVPAPSSPAANGATARAPSAPAAPRPAPAPSPVEEESPVWDKLAADTEDPTAKVDTAPRGTGRPGSSRRRNAPPPAVDRRRLWWLLGIVTVAACGLVAGVVWFALHQGSETGKPVVPDRPVIRVNDTGNPGTVRSLSAALSQIRGKAVLGGRIVLEQDVAEEIEVIKIQNATIETEEGHPPVTWKPVAKPGGKRLLFVSYAADFHLKNVILDGEGREEALIDLFGTCPGTTLENVAFKGMGKYGVRVLNCEGGRAAGRQVSLSGLFFHTAKPDQAGLFFDARDNIVAIPRNRDIAVRNCHFDGPGARIKVADPAKLERVEFPNDVQPVAGR